MRVRREVIRRVTITGAVGERAAAFAYCADHGLRAVFYGPLRLRGMAGHAAKKATGSRLALVDTTRFRLVAEAPAEVT